MDRTHFLASHPHYWPHGQSEDDYYRHFGTDPFAGVRRGFRALGRALRWARSQRRAKPGAAAAQTVL